MQYSNLINLINNNCQITIISSDKHVTSNVSRIYFNLYHNPLYCDRISISKAIIVNYKNRLSVRGKVTKKENMKQIHFVNIDKLEKWMLESNERIYSEFRDSSIGSIGEDLKDQHENLKDSKDQHEDLKDPKDQDQDLELKVLKKYKIYSKIMYKQRIIILLDNVQIPDNLNPSISIVGNEIDTLEHHEWKLYLGNLIKNYNELKSKYFFMPLKTKKSTRKKTKKTIKTTLFDEFEFSLLTDEEKQIIHEVDNAESFNLHSSASEPLSEAQLQAQIRLQAQITNFNASRIYSDVKDSEIKNEKSDLEILQDKILDVYHHEPDPEHPKYVTKFDILDENSIHSELKIPTGYELLLSMDESRLLNEYSKYAFVNGTAILFSVAVNGLPKLINYKAPNYLNEQEWKDINILKIDYMIISTLKTSDSKRLYEQKSEDFEHRTSSKHNIEILKQASYYVANPDVHNTVRFEVNNKISDEYRNEHGRSFSEIAEFIKNDITVFDVKYVISHGTDVNYNLLLIEYVRNMLEIDVFKNMLVINTKQYLWKQNMKEKMEDFEECKNCKTKLDMIYNLLKRRLGYI